MKLYVLNEKESGKLPSCVAIPPQTGELTCSHAILENKLRWLLQLWLKSMLGVKQLGIREVLRINKEIDG